MAKKKQNPKTGAVGGANNTASIAGILENMINGIDDSPSVAYESPDKDSANKKNEADFRGSNADRRDGIRRTPKKKPVDSGAPKPDSKDGKDSKENKPAGTKPSVEPEKKSITIEEKEFLMEYFPEFDAEALERIDTEFNEYQKALNEYRDRQMEEAYKKAQAARDEEARNGKGDKGGKKPKKQKKRHMRLDPGSTALLIGCVVACIATFLFLHFGA